MGSFSQVTQQVRRRTRRSRLAVLSYYVAFIGPLTLLGLALACVNRSRPDLSSPILHAIEFWPGPAAIVLAALALFAIKRSRVPLSGRSHAVAGAVLGLAAVLVMPTAAGLVHFTMSEPDMACATQLMQIGKAMSQYCEDWQGYYPAGMHWNNSVRPYFGGHSDGLLACPSADDRTVPSYAMNRRLAGARRPDSEDDQAVLLFDSVSGRNLVGGPELLPKRPRHAGHNVLFTNGHARLNEPEREVLRLKWIPDADSNQRERR